MKGSNIVSAIHHLRMAKEFFESFRRDYPSSRGDKLFGSYINKVEFIYKDMISYPHLNDEVRDGIRAEWQSDVFAVPALFEKIPLLNPEQRELIETTIDAMLNGEEIKIVEA
jgi:hypothetical protein